MPQKIRKCDPKMQKYAIKWHVYIHNSYTKLPIFPPWVFIFTLHFGYNLACHNDLLFYTFRNESVASLGQDKFVCTEDPPTSTDVTTQYFNMAAKYSGISSGNFEPSLLNIFSHQ
jgi:hypothetical protein